MRGCNGLYLVGNYPDAQTFIETAREGLKYFDFLEIGIPFTDPVADGPVIAAAAEEMICRGFRLDDLLKSIGSIRRETAPEKKLYFMTYANIIFGRGIGRFASLCGKNGIRGVIAPDIPWVESGRFKKAFNACGVEFIHFITPENTDAQIRAISGGAGGFIYFVSMRGITGGELDLGSDTKKKIALAKKSSAVPVVLGFGIRDLASARAALESADGFIIGTKVIELMKSGGGNAVQGFFRGLDAV